MLKELFYFSVGMHFNFTIYNTIGSYFSCLHGSYFPGCLKNHMHVSFPCGMVDHLTLEVISPFTFLLQVYLDISFFAEEFSWVFEKIFQLLQWQKPIHTLHNLLTWFIKRYIKSSTFMQCEDRAFWEKRRSVMIAMHPGITCNGRNQIGAIIPLFIIKPSDGC